MNISHKFSGKIIDDHFSFEIIPNSSLTKPPLRGFINVYKYVKIIFQCKPTRLISKSRQIGFKLRTSNIWNIWNEDFSNYCGEIIKEKFINMSCLGTEIENDDDLVWDGIITIKDMNWDEAGKDIFNGREKMVQDISTLISNEESSDFTFICEGEEIKVHKNILACRSKVLNRMFFGAFNESRTKQVEIKDTTVETFREFIYFLYTGTLHLESSVSVTELLVIADKYEVTDLMKLCERKLLKNINEHNALEIYCLATRTGIQCSNELKKVSFAILSSKFSQINIELPPELMNSPEKVIEAFKLKENLLNLVKSSSTLLEIDDSASTIANETV